MEMYRLGDALLVKATIPKGAKKQVVDKRIVLAWGETSGHAHAIDAMSADLCLSGQDRSIMAKTGAQLVHEEHAAIALTPGAYKVVQQREFLPAGIRGVID